VLKRSREIFNRNDREGQVIKECKTEASGHQDHHQEWAMLIQHRLRHFNSISLRCKKKSLISRC